MGVLVRETLQTLAVLEALRHWKNGANGAVRLQNTLFLADNENDPEWVFFNYKRHILGQYSEEISEALNRLQGAGRVKVLFDGPSERLSPILSNSERRRIRSFFRTFFLDWSKGFDKAFRKWASLKNDDVIRRAQEEDTYTSSESGEIILTCGLPETVEFSGLGEAEAESLALICDEKFQRNLRHRFLIASESPPRSEDWRKIYFPRERIPSKRLSTAR